MEKKQFVDDISITGALTGILLRSPVVTGTLKEIRTPKLPYNVSLVTASDIPGLKVCGPGQTEKQDGALHSSKNFFEIPVFPGKELSWYGQPVAMLLGPDPVKLRELAEQCSILTEQETENGPMSSDPQPEEEKKTIIIERNFSSGSITEAFEKAEMIVEGNYSSGLQDPWPSDPLGAIAVPGPGNTMTIHTATQWPGHVRSSVAQCLNVKTSMVEVEVSRLEIHLDGRIWPPSLLACQAAVGALLCDKPVKLVLRRDEDFLFSPKSAGAEIRIQSALDKQGSILGTKLKAGVNFGAFGIFADEILDRIVLGALGAYNHKSSSLEGRGFSTPVPPAGPTAGFGLAQGFFAAERHASHIAESVGKDPSEWRKNFLFHKGKKLPIGIEIKNPPLQALIDSAETMSDYRRKWAAYELLRKDRRENTAEKKLYEPLRGIGISLAYQGNTLLHNYCEQTAAETGVELTLEKDGVLEIRTDLPWGDNQILIWHAMAAKILGVENIRIISKSDFSKNSGESGPACLSRSVAVITPLIEKACNAIRKHRFRDPLPITVHQNYRSMEIPAWGMYSSSSLPEETKIDENALSSPGWASAVVEAEIDPASYTPRIRGIWLCLDGGTILSEERAKKSIHSASLEALSWAMQEQVVYKNGRIGESCFRDYQIRSIEALPVTIDFLWSEGDPRGIGELPFATIPAAYAQALSQALDYHFERYPVGSQDIWAAIQKAATEEKLS